MQRRATVNVQPQRPAPQRSEPQRSEPIAPDRQFGFGVSSLGVRDPTPLKDAAAFWRIMAQAATIAMALIIFGAFLYVASPLLVPVLCALVVSLTLGPWSARATRLGLPAWIPAIVIVALLAAGLYLAMALLSEPATQLIGRSAEIGTTIREKFRFMDRPLAALRELQAALLGSSGVSLDLKDAGIFGMLATALPSFVLQLVLFFVTLFFFMFGRRSFRSTVVNLFATRDGRLRALKIANDVESNLSGYLITVTAINFGVGAVATLVTWWLGFPAPLLWGALAFILNYIPYVGPGVVQVTLFLIGLVTFDTFAPALIAPLLFMAFTFVEGHFLVPAVIGRQFVLNPLAVILSLAFWAWLWGPIGAFLATPLLIIAIVVIDHMYPRIESSLPE